MSTNAPTPEPSTAPERKPWPMKWVVYAILIYAFLQTLYLFISTRGK